MCRVSPKLPHSDPARGLGPPSATRLSQDLGFGGLEKPRAIQLIGAVAKLPVLRLSNRGARGKATDEAESGSFSDIYALYLGQGTRR